MSTLRDEIATVLNRASSENESGTPDFVLAEYLVDSLAAFDKATNIRDRWWGHDPKIGGVIPAKRPLG